MSKEPVSAASADEHSFGGSKEKDAASHDETVSHSDLLGASADAEFGGPEERAKLEKRLLWKVDLRMSILVVIYILNYIDRNNASAARLRGLEADLHLTGQQFPTLLSILYVGYILFQVPSNMFLNKIGKPSLYIPACMIIWGMISVLTGTTKDFTGALLTRFFLGIVEAAFFPGALFMISKWYTRKELSLRTSILYCGNLISNAFGNLIAAGVLDNMQGKLGHAAWRWLFFIEGSLTMFIAVLAIFILPDFPSTTSWLSPQERRLAEIRMAEDVGESDSENDGALRGLYLALTDWKIWWLSLALTAQVIGLAFNQYFPTLTATLGYSRTVSLLLCAPPWAFATIVAFFNARHADKTGEKFFHIALPLFFGIVGFIIALATDVTAARYVSLFLMAQSYAGFIAWSGSFYPQAYLNYRRKFVGGLSIDFCSLNLLGHISYGAYNIAFYYDRDVQEEYQRKHHGTENTVQVNDVAFSIHASLMASVWLLQTLYYPREPGQRTSTFNRVVMLTYGLIVIINVWSLLQGRETLYEFVSVLSLFKLYVSVAKYVPQAWGNYKHQSTSGWSIQMVMLDFSGGFLSFVQLFTDAARTSDWTAVTENPAKFGLSILSMIFTGFYIIQHFVLYPDHHDVHSTKDAEISNPAQDSIGEDAPNQRSRSGERAPLLGP